MKQLETRNQNLIANVLNFYREIGIESIISDNNFYKETFSSINNKKDTRQKQNHYEQKIENYK